MAGFEIFYHPRVVARDIPKLDAPARKRVRAAIERKLIARPEQFAKPLAFTRARLWTLRVGPWRVVFAMRRSELWVLRIGHRSEVYEDLSGRYVPSS